MKNFSLTSPQVVVGSFEMKLIKKPPTKQIKKLKPHTKKTKQKIRDSEFE